MAIKFNELISFDKSIGYDCKKLDNLCLLESNILAFASGNLIHFFHIDSGHMQTLAGVGEQGISCITKNPNPKYSYLTLAEYGTKPKILILNYPDMTIASSCENGAEQSYSCVSYNSSGELMVSQGAAPDFTLTIWNWRSSSIIFRTQSADIDVLCVRFSTHNNEQLVTGGVTHIKFWTMCRTFTGLKLGTVPGRFGHADMCNVIGLCAMPDRKVLSNSAWGSILVWTTDGNIKFEVCQKNRMPCHLATVSQIIYDDGDVMTVGQDGYVRVWFWKSVDLAEPTEEQPFVEIDPTFEYFVGNANHTCQLLTMVRGLEERCWFAQDGNGGIWKCDFRSVYDGKCEMLYRCHAGGVIGLACSPYTAHMVTLGLDGRAHLYDYEAGQLLCYHQFPAGGKDLLWVPKEIDASGIVIVAAFADGVIRVFCVDLLQYSFHFIQAIKSHSDAVNRILLNTDESILVSGSDDHTIFVHQIAQYSPYIRLKPIGLVKMSAAVTALEWNRQKTSTVLVGCANGELNEVIVPTKTKSYDDVTYVLTNIEQRKIKLTLPQIRANNAECDAGHLGRILWLKETGAGVIHVSMSGDYAGYVYEFGLEDEANIISSSFIENNVDISCLLILSGCTIFGLSNGKMSIRPSLMMSDTSTDTHTVNLHNNLYGRITSIGVSFDKRYLISIGLDGNIFTFKLNPSICTNNEKQLPNEFIKPCQVADILDANHLSLEEQKKQSYRDERIHLVNKKKSQMLEVLAMLKEDFAGIKNRNDLLPESERLSAAELELDERITRDMANDFAREMDLMRCKMAFDVEKSKLLKNKVENFMTRNLECWPIAVRGIRIDTSVETFRIAKTSDDFLTMKADLDKRIANNSKVQNSISAQTVNRLVEIIETSSSEEQVTSSNDANTVLQVLISSTDGSKFDLQMKRLFKKYSERKFEEAERKKMWQYINSMVPDPSILDPNDAQALKAAKETIGNYRLKTDPDYIPTEDDISTAARKFKQLLSVKEEIHTLRNNYNRKIFRVRQKRVELCQFIKQQNEILMKIHEEIPNDKVQCLDRVRSVGDDTVVPDAILNGQMDDSGNIEGNTEDSQSDCSVIRVAVDALRNYQHDMGREDPTDQSWEKEFQTVHQIEKLFQQSRIIAEFRDRIDDFDNEIIELQNARLDVDIKSKFLEAYSLSLYQEVWILKDFEEVETDLLTRISTELGKCEEIKLEYLSEKTKADSCLTNISELREETRSIQSSLKQECTGSEHENYLMKMFQRNSDAHSPQSTDDCDSIAESTDLNSTGSNDVDIRLVGVVKGMRQQRLAIETRIKKEMESMEMCQAKMDQLMGDLNTVEKNIINHKEKLKNFSLEKQNMVNNIETLAIMRFDQMQYFTNETELYEIEDTLVVNHDTISKLFQRVGQLDMETVEEQRKHRIYKMHLARLKTDCNFMGSEIMHLKDKTNSIMLKKFGTIIDLDEMEESILKKFLLNAQGSAEAIDKEYQKKANELKKSIVQKEVEYLKAKQERIEKMHVLAALQEEKNMLEEAISYQNRMEAKLMAMPPNDFGHDLTKLKEICQQQQDQLMMLKKETQTLRLKAKPFDPHPPNIAQHMADYAQLLHDEHSIDGGTRPSSTRSSVSRVTSMAGDSNSLRKIMGLVERFLGKCIAMHLDASTLESHAKKISHYLVQVISNYDVENTDDVTRCVAENLKRFLPKRALRYIQTRDLAQLFNEVIQMFGDDDEHFTIEELLENIVAELKIKVSRDSQNYSGSFICEFLEDIFAVLPLEEVNKGNRVKEVAAALRKVAHLDRSQIDVTKTAAEVSAYFGNSLGNNMSTENLKRFIDDLVSNL